MATTYHVTASAHLAHSFPHINDRMSHNSLFDDDSDVEMDHIQIYRVGPTGPAGNECYPGVIWQSIEVDQPQQNEEMGLAPSTELIKSPSFQPISPNFCKISPHYSRPSPCFEPTSPQYCPHSPRYVGMSPAVRQGSPEWRGGSPSLDVASPTPVESPCWQPDSPTYPGMPSTDSVASERVSPCYAPHSPRYSESTPVSREPTEPIVTNEERMALLKHDVGLNRNLDEINDYLKKNYGLEIEKVMLRKQESEREAVDVPYSGAQEYHLDQRALLSRQLMSVANLCQ